MSNSPNNNYGEIALKDLMPIIKDWFEYLKIYWWQFSLLGLIGGVLGFVYANKQPINYTAKTTFVVEDGKGGGASLGGLASLAGQFGVDVSSSSGGGIFSGDNILLYFKSPTLAREVLLSRYDTNSHHSLADTYIKVYKLKDKWDKFERNGDINFPVMGNSTRYSRLQDSLLGTIVEIILAKQFFVQKTDKKAGFIDVTTIMQDEQLSKTYCERIVNLAVEKYVGIKTMRQKSIVEKLQKRVDSIAYLLREKTYSGAALQNSNSIMDINPIYKTENNVAIETSLRDKSMLTNIFASVTQSLEMSKFSLSQETPVIQIVDSPLLPLKVDKTSRLKMIFLFASTLCLVQLIFLVFKRLFSK